MIAMAASSRVTITSDSDVVETIRPSHRRPYSFAPNVSHDVRLGSTSGPHKNASFAVAIAHGAGLMLVPIYLGLCRTADLSRGHDAAGALINANLGMAVLVSVVHSVAMPQSVDSWHGWSIATWVSNSCHRVGSIWIRLGPLALSWWALCRL
jgi:hypothetical protein